MGPYVETTNTTFYRHQLKPTRVFFERAIWWKQNMEISVAGLGWVTVFPATATTIDVWSNDPESITTRQAFLEDNSHVWEKPGFDRSTKLLATAKQNMTESGHRTLLRLASTE